MTTNAMTWDATDACNSDVKDIDKTTVFVVDDDESLRRALARLLQSHGFGVETFASALEFLQRLPYAGTGCLVLDVQMPGMSGVELQDRMQCLGVVLPVVFLTAHGDVPTATRAMKTGATDFLQKPVDEATLLATIHASLARHRLQRIDQRQRDEVTARLARLTPRESDVLRLVIAGQLNKQVADQLGIALKTVKVHRARVMEKMEADSLAALVHACDLLGMESS